MAISHGGGNMCLVCSGRGRRRREGRREGRREEGGRGEVRRKKGERVGGTDKGEREERSHYAF